MDQYIECPVCEERFHVQVDDPSSKINCPGCARRFKVSSAIKLKAPAPSPVSTHDAKSSPAASTSRLAVPLTPAHSTDEPEMTMEPEPPKEPDKVVNLPKSKPLTGSVLKHRRRNKKKAIGALATVGILATIIGILSGLLVMQLQKNPLSSKPDDENIPVVEPDQLTQIDAEKKSDPNNSNESAIENTKTERSKTPEEKIRLADLPPQKYVFHDKEAVSKCWDLVHPHLVNLTVHDAVGSHQAVGTLIDSRGWLLTSYSSVKGASKIDVAASVKSIDQLPKPDLLTDVVRGVIKIDPENDIAILSINRRFVVSFADIEITTENHVVEGEYLIQCAPPSLANPYARHESKIKISDKFDALPDAAQSEIRRRAIESAGQTWLAVDNDNHPLPGSPLVRIDGTLEAVNVFSKDEFSYYLPLDQLKPLIAGAKNEPQPLSTLGGSDLASGQPLTVGTRHPIRQTSIQITILAKACDDFGWLPTNKEQYDELQEFAEQFAKAIKYVKEHRESDPELSKEAEYQIETVNNSILKALGQLKPQSYAAIEQMNKFANEDLKTANRTIPIYGKVFELEVSAGSDILQLFRMESFVALKKDPSRERFEREGECLAFVRTPETPRTLNYNADKQTISATSVSLVTRIDRPDR